MIDKKKLADIMANQDPNTTLEVQNPEVEKLIDVYKEENTPDNLNLLLNKARLARFLVPANVAENKQPLPMMIKNDEGELFTPASHILKRPQRALQF